MPLQRSKPLSEFPAYLSSISMVVDDIESIVRDLIHAEHKSPPQYDAARDLSIRVLQGDLSFESALRQAEQLRDETHRKCAIEVLNTAKSFLISAVPAHVALLSEMNIRLPNGMALKVSPVWLRETSPPRLMILYFWLKPFSERQLAATASVLSRALHRHQTKYRSIEIDFISVSKPENSPERRLRCLDWKHLHPMTDTELEKFLQQLCQGWSVYKSRGPRYFQSRRDEDLLSWRPPIT